MEKAKKMPIGTVSHGRKKIAEGKWVPVKKEGSNKANDGKYKYLKPGRDYTNVDLEEQNRIDMTSRYDELRASFNKNKNSDKDMLEYYKIMGDMLNEKLITPRSVVGTGYKNGRKVAKKWIEYQINKYSKSLFKSMRGSSMKMKLVMPMLDYERECDVLMPSELLKANGYLGRSNGIVESRQVFLDELNKSKYLRRWKGKNGEWNYEYPKSKKERKQEAHWKDQKGKRVQEVLSRVKEDGNADILISNPHAVKEYVSTHKGESFNVGSKRFSVGKPIAAFNDRLGMGDRVPIKIFPVGPSKNANQVVVMVEGDEEIESGVHPYVNRMSIRELSTTMPKVNFGSKADGT